MTGIPADFTAGREVRYERLKRTVSKVTASPALGRQLGRLFRDRLPYYGGRVATDHPVVSDVMKSMIFWRLYEAPEVRFIRRYLPDDLDAIDVGANIGVTSFHLSRALRSGRRLVAVEAHPTLPELIRANCRLAAPGADVRVVHAAVVGRSFPNPTVRFQLHDNPHCSTVALPGGPAADVVAVPAVTVSALKEANDIGRFVLTSDIEGGETAFIFDDPEALDGCARMVIELHDTSFDGRPVTVQDLVRALVDTHGFRILGQHRDTFALERR